MSSTAVVLGGTGQVGVAVACRLVDAGYEVTVCHRGSRALPAELGRGGVRERVADRSDPNALRALAQGADVVVDVIAFDAADAARLTNLGDAVGSIVAISSASVYRDAEGRTLDEADDDDEMPQLPFPVSEEQATVAAGDATYSTRKVAMERALLDGPAPATILRPGAIHGPHSRHAREWYFLKRALDRRPVLVIDHDGESRFGPTSVDNLAQLVLLAAQRPGRRVLNCGDPDPPTTLEISRAVCAHVEHEPDDVILLAGQASRPEVGGTPWSLPHPFVLGMERAERELGYRPPTTYAEALPRTLDWLIEAVSGGDWRELLPQLAAYPWELFDYEAEDRFVAERT